MRAFLNHNHSFTLFLSSSSTVDKTLENLSNRTLPLNPKNSFPSPTSTEEKMHQTSSRLMRTTSDGRPFTRDFKDLFGTLIVSFSLSTHRVRFRAYPYTFTTEEAIANLGNLRFSQSNRMPDPNDPQRIVVTTTTTTFSMAKDMAKSLCQRFFDARFIENAVDDDVSVFKDKCLWQLTSKGIAVLHRFVNRNGITADHVSNLLHSPLNTMQLVILERDERTDKLSHDKASIEILFSRFAGKTPNIKNSSTLSDSDSVSEYNDGLCGVKLLDRRQVGDRYVYNSFTGRTGARWLMDCSTIIDPMEVVQIATSFLDKGLIESSNGASREQQAAGRGFFVSKYAIYSITARGKRVAWESGPSDSRPNSQSTSAPHTYLAKKTVNMPVENSISAKSIPSKSMCERETNGSRLESILNNPPQRMLFAEFLRENFCEENLAFYTDLTEFMRDATTALSVDRIRDCIACAYGIYNRYLAPGSPNELNLDSSLRLDMATRMTKTVGSDDKKMRGALKEIIELLERARKQIFKLMAGDSVPKFVKTLGYREIAGIEDNTLCTPPGTPGN